MPAAEAQTLGPPFAVFPRPWARIWIRSSVAGHELVLTWDESIVGGNFTYHTVVLASYNSHWTFFSQFLSPSILFSFLFSLFESTIFRCLYWRHIHFYIKNWWIMRTKQQAFMMGKDKIKLGLVWWLKSLILYPMAPASYISTCSCPVGSCPVPIQLHACDLEKQQRITQVFGTLHACGKPRRCFWLWVGSALAIEHIQKVNQSMKNLLSISPLCKYVFQIKINKYFP